MDNHPIPQDVTGFQFKLIGSMTVKQFAYIAVGGVLAVVSFHVPTNGSFFILIGKYLFMVLFALTAVALAFLPLEGRPLDTMIINFVKALFRPNQYIFQKSGGHLAFLHFTPTVALVPAGTGGGYVAQNSEPAPTKRDTAKEQKLQALLQSIHSQTPGSQTPYDEKEAQFMRLVTGGQATTTPQPTTAPPPPTPTAAPAIAVSAPPPPVSTPASSSSSETPAISDRLHTALSNVALPKTPSLPPLPTAPPPTPQTAPTPAPVEAPPPAPVAAPAPEQPQTALQPAAPQPPAPPTLVTADTARALGLPHLPDSPNLILGIVKDSRGNVLSNVLVEVKDEAGNPVRAFKTNALGQFASATMLQNGTYTVDFEDPKNEHKFASAQLIADGTILQPLIITSTDAREELRRSLFG